MVDARKYFGATFVTLKDVVEGPLRVTIDSAAEGQYGKLNVNFEEGFALSLNATNTRELAKAYGGDTDGWLGHVIELYAGEIEFQGKLQPAVRLKPISAPVQATTTPEQAAAVPRQAASRNSDMDDDIPF